MSNWPFNADLPRNRWTQIQAEGFPDPVPGCVYDGRRLDGGIPLGGLGTGYFTLEGNGLIGHCSIFNDIVPPRADFREWLTLRIVGAESLPLSTADIACWGHHPVADLVCRFEAKGLELGIRAFAPLIPGDSADSNIPAALFEIEIRSSRADALDLELIVEAPNASGSPTYERGPHDIALAGEDIDVLRNGDELRGRIARTIAANGSARVRFVFAWHSPYWRDSDKLWTGEYYRVWHDPQNTSGEGTDCDASLGNQLMAQWCTRIAGLPDTLPAEQVQSALGVVKRLNMAATEHGLVNGVNPDGTRHVSRPDPAAHPNLLPNYDHARQTFFAENLCAAMNFIYHGQPETGLEIARRLYEAVALTSRTPWKQYCMFDADSGLPVWGEDYYSNMVIWALPMALAGQDIADFARGDLIREVIGSAR